MPIPPRPRRLGAHVRVTTASLEAMADHVLLAPVAAARNRIQNPRELSERVAFGKALWRELVIGFAAQLGDVRLGFTQLAALYALADGGTTTIADLADTLNRSPSATSRLVDGLAHRRLLERRAESEDRRMRSVWLTERGRALLAVIDRSRADQFLAVVRPLPATERAIVAMGVAALATRAVSRRGRLIKQRPE
jgi:DNA-binding MarR family transcriptional regulator